MALCMFDIGALVKSSVVWLTVLKWAGRAYLAWLAIKLWRAPPIALEKPSGESGVPGTALFRQGWLFFKIGRAHV
mgnify:FL=1